MAGCATDCGIILSDFGREGSRVEYHNALAPRARCFRAEALQHDAGIVLVPNYKLEIANYKLLAYLIQQRSSS